MSTQPNYFKVGIFVLLAIAMILGAIIFFSVGIIRRPKLYFETYFDASISGLSVGAPVEVRGVKIGQVEKITFVSREYNINAGPGTFSKYQRYVMVVGSVDEKNLPFANIPNRNQRMALLVNNGLRLQLSSELLTGIAYLEATFLDPNRYPVMDIAWKPKDLYIPSAPGQLTTLKDSVDKILVKLEKVDTAKIADQIQQILQSVDQAIADANIGALGSQARGLITDLRGSNKELQKMLTNSKADPNIANLPQTFAQLNVTLERIDRLVATKSPYLEAILENARQAMANISEATGSLKENPSSLLFSSPPQKSEVYK